MKNYLPMNYDAADMEVLRAKMRTAASTTPSFEQLAYYIDQNLSQIVFMTANEVAAEVGISQGSVSRFCTALGFRGYSDFQHTLRSFVRKEPAAAQTSEYLSKVENIDEIIHGAQKGLDRLKQVFANPAYLVMLEQLSAIDRIILISSRVSGTLLPYFSYQLKRIGKDVSIVAESDLSWEGMEAGTFRNAAFFTIMFPQYSHSLIFKLERLKDKEIPVMGITDSSLSPLATLAEPVLCLPLVSNVPFGAYSAPVLFLSILTQDLAARSEDSRNFISRLDVVEEDSYVFHRCYRTHL